MSKGSQRYEIYINEKPLTLISEAELGSISIGQNSLVMPYSGQTKTLFQYLDILETGDRFDQIVLHATTAQDILKDVKKILQQIDAAGGVIENSKQEILLIFRRSFWDLPKGKLDKTEDFETASIRECIEETGLTDLKLIQKIGTTYHFFRDKNNLRSLKKTKWFHIQLLSEQNLIPQIEEDIELAEWVNPIKALQLNPIYKNILEVIKMYNELVKK